MDHQSKNKSKKIPYSQIEPYFGTLRPIKTILETSLSFSTISSPNPKSRTSFYDNQLKPQELAVIEKLKDIEKPGWWREGDSLRFIHAHKFDTDLTRNVRKTEETNFNFFWIFSHFFRKGN